MASTSASASAGVYPPIKSCFEVFLNHRGPDTKDKFALPLYKKLDGLLDIRVFLDKEELQVGEFIASQIHEAIRAASVHVAIFSPKYAESYWCLDELHAMVESGKPIIPVFFDVEPGELKRTHGDYARALSVLEKKITHDGQPRHNPSTVQNWRNALFTVADISGLELKTFNGDEEKLLDEVVKSVWKKLNKTRFDVAEHPTGLDEKMEKFEEFLQQQSSKPLVIGIVGMGGIGKTTFVEELFNRKSSRYNKSCFIRDVREKARKSSLESLQNKLLNSLTTWRGVEIESVDQGRDMLKTHAKSCQALVILDDVDSANQLYALLSPIRDVLGPESLILITSRDKAVLTKSGAIYMLDGLNPQHSKELFCLNAFNLPHPLPGFQDLVEKYLKVCNGLPLSLKVLGGLVFENDRSSWEVHLKRIQQVIPQEIKSILQISYDTLQRDEKQMFLDIACFFIGKKKETTIRIWQGFGWEGLLAGFQSLQNKNLVQVDSKNEIRMHDHLRDLGRDLAKDPSLPRRIWGREDMDLLQQSPGRTVVRGISLGFRECEDLSFSGCKMKNLRLLDIHSTGDFLESILNKVQSPNLIWLRWDTRVPWMKLASWIPRKKLPSWIPMKKLRVLQVSTYVLETLWQEKSQAPLQLRELQIDGPLRDIPESIVLLKHLQHLELNDELNKYKNDVLERLPDSFGNLKNLQHVKLSGCSMLERLPDSFGNLINLQHINLSRCSRLKILPDSFENLINLQHINLYECSKLERLPDSFGNLINLQHLDLSQPWRTSGLERLPDSFGNLRRLKYLDLSHWFNLITTSETLGGISTLEYLSLSCGMEVLPPQVAHQRSLKELNLWIPRLTGFPSDIGELRNLKKLVLFRCYKLKCLPDSLGQLNQLTELIISQCGLVEVGTLPDALIKLELLSCINLKCWPDSIGRLNQLTTLKIYFCRNLVEIGTLPDTLEELSVSITNLRSISGLARLTKLREIHLHGCYKLKELVGVEHVSSLERLCMEGCPNLQLGDGVDPRIISAFRKANVTLWTSYSTFYGRMSQSTIG